MRTWRLPTISPRPLEAVLISQSSRITGRPFSTTNVRFDLWTLSRILNYDKPEPKTHVSLNAWVRTVRKQKRIAFCALGDGSSHRTVQAVLSPEQAEGLSPGTAVHVFGRLQTSLGGQQSHELRVKSIHVLGENDAEKNPLQPKYQTPEFLRTVPHLRPRIPHNATLLRLRSQIIASLTRYFTGQDFVQCHTPIISSSDCEGAGEVFTVSANSGDQQPSDLNPADKSVDHFFKTPKYLTVSSQLHLEALASAIPKVWTLSPTFRAEKSDTPRHLSEFYMLEAEVSFTSDLRVVMNVLEGMLRHVAVELQGTRAFSDLMNITAGEDPDQPSNPLRARWEGMAARDWPKITYTNAINILREAHAQEPFANEPNWEEGLAAEHERHIASEIGKGRPVFVTNYPRHQKPFYMSPTTVAQPGQDQTSTAENFDLLVPDLCELAGGSMREHRAEELLTSMRVKGVDPAKLDWYVDLRRYGSVPHGGFGLGFDRLICYLGGEGNLREVVAWPRWVGRAEG